MLAVWIGSSFQRHGSLLHILIAAIAALLGALWAGIAGFLKATVGAHEVISTIMSLDRDLVGVFLSASAGAPERHPDLRPDLERCRRGRQASRLLGRSDLQGLHIGFFVAIGALSSTG